MNTWKSNVNAFSFSNGKQVVAPTTWQHQDKKKSTYLCLGCSKSKVITGVITPEESFCSCGDQFVKEWEHNHLKASKNPNTPKKNPPPSDAEILAKVGFNLRGMS